MDLQDQSFPDHEPAPEETKEAPHDYTFKRTYLQIRKKKGKVTTVIEVTKAQMPISKFLLKKLKPS
jgi:uncharacterized protein YxeA